MRIEKLFPTYFCRTRIAANLFRTLNPRLQKECYIFRDLDKAGRAWSRERYWSGYTSYSSLTDLPFRSPTFDSLKKSLDREVVKFVETLEWNLQGGRLKMSTCWINIMGQGCHHSAHLHPRSVISGTYFVKIPNRSGGFQIEDPRLASFMGTPEAKQKSKMESRRYIQFQPKAGDIFLFESWLKHQVPANRSTSDRISISFNYDWI